MLDELYGICGDGCCPPPPPCPCQCDQFGCCDKSPKPIPCPRPPIPCPSRSPSRSPSPSPISSPTSSGSPGRLIQSSNRLDKTLELVGYVGNYTPTRSFFSVQIVSGLISCTSCTNKAAAGALVALFGFLSLLSCFTDSDMLDNGDVKFKFLWRSSGHRCSDDCSGDKCGRKHNTKVTWPDMLHAIMNVLVYIVYTLSDQTVAESLFPCTYVKQKNTLRWGRLISFVVSTVVSVICPINRQGAGFAVVKPDKSKDETSSLWDTLRELVECCFDWDWDDIC